MTISDIPSAGSSSSRLANVHRVNKIQFMDPTTHPTLDPALELVEVKEGTIVDASVVVEEIPDIVLSSCGECGMRKRYRIGGGAEVRRCGKAMKRNCGTEAKSAERRKDAASTYVLRPRFQISCP